MPHENGQLTAEEIEPTEEQLELGRRLVRGGWKSTSNKYRTLRRWAGDPHAEIRALIRPELMETPAARWVLAQINDHQPWLRTINERFFPVEECTLTVREYRAFRLAGGISA
jgi:hypothetical protein